MIEKLTIQNFQAHRLLEIEFDPHITSIIGPNDAGKSTIVRALRWLTLNKPTKGTFIRWGKKKLSVTMEIDGELIVRVKTEKINQYSLGDRKFKSFGANVPEPIANLLNMSEINFQKQIDAHFWFSESAGEVSKQLNQIVNLGIIDSSIGHISAELRKAKATEEVCQKRFKDCKETVKQLAWIEECAAEYEATEKLRQKWQATAEEHEELQALLSEADRIEAAKGKAAKYYKAAVEDMQKVKKAGEEWTETGVQYDGLVSTIRNYKFILESKCQREQELRDAEQELHSMMKGKCPLCGKRMQ